MDSFEKFYVGNLSPKATRDSLLKYLGLNATPYLRSSSWVELPQDQSGKPMGFAYVSVPHHMANHLIQLNNTKYMERRITIQLIQSRGVQQPFRPIHNTNLAMQSWVGPRNRRYGGQPISYEMVNIPLDKKVPLIDVAVNMANKIFSLDLDFVIDRALNSGVEKMILTANTLQMSDKSVMLANQHPGILFAGVGIHPHFVEKQWNAKNIEVIKRLVALPEVIAIGEVGLDFHRNYSKEAVQIEAFEKQVELACEHQKPLLAHERKSHDKFIEVLKKFRGRLPPIVVHCFTGTKAELNTYIAMGFYIGITGFICKEKAGKELREAIKDCPLDRILLESGAPYMIPNAPITTLDSIGRSLLAKCQPSRNEPCTLPVVAQTVAKLMDITVEEVAKATVENSKRVFNLSHPHSAVKDDLYGAVKDELYTPKVI